MFKHYQNKKMTIYWKIKPKVVPIHIGQIFQALKAIMSTYGQDLFNKIKSNTQKLIQNHWRRYLRKEVHLSNQAPSQHQICN